MKIKLTRVAIGGLSRMAAIASFQNARRIDCRSVHRDGLEFECHIELPRPRRLAELRQLFRPYTVEAA